MAYPRDHYPVHNNGMYHHVNWTWSHRVQKVTCAKIVARTAFARTLWRCCPAHAVLLLLLRLLLLLWAALLLLLLALQLLLYPALLLLLRRVLLHCLRTTVIKWLRVCSCACTN